MRTCLFVMNGHFFRQRDEKYRRTSRKLSFFRNTLHNFKHSSQSNFRCLMINNDFNLFDFTFSIRSSIPLPLLPHTPFAFISLDRCCAVASIYLQNPEKSLLLCVCGVRENESLSMCIGVCIIASAWERYEIDLSLSSSPFCSYSIIMIHCYHTTKRKELLLVYIMCICGG